jgi:hypothetical membrane protein
VSISRPALAGGLSWIVAALVFLAGNVVTGFGWRRPSYSWAAHNVSDLGNVTCGVWDTTRPRYVCSPWHAVMNTTFVLSAALLALGIVLTWRAAGRGAGVRTVQVLLLFATVGYALAGFFPADANENAHFLGALLIVVLGNIGLVVAGLVRGGGLLGEVRALSLVAGLTAVAGTVLFFSQHGLGIGLGGMERVAAFPLWAWASVAGVVLLRRRPSRLARSSP